MVYFDVAALLITLIAVGKFLEVFAMGRAGEAIEALASIQPRTAHLIAGDQVVDLPVEEFRNRDAGRRRERGHAASSTDVTTRCC